MGNSAFATVLRDHVNKPMFYQITKKRKEKELLRPLSIEELCGSGSNRQVNTLELKPVLELKG